MLCFVKQVGSNFGVLDTDDGALDWITKEQLLNFAKKVNIIGVEKNTLTPTVCELNASKCNWSKGNNIFKTIKHFQYNGKGEFQITTQLGKKYKGTLILGRVNYLKFSSNILVSLSVRNANLITNLNSLNLNTLLANFRQVDV